MSADPKPIWLLYGGRGWIGQQFVDVIDRDGGIDLRHGASRCDDTAALTAEVESLRPDRVISMIGRTSGPASAPVAGASESSSLKGKILDTDNSTIDWLEKPGNLRHNLRDNLFAPLLLERICAARGIHFTYLGTGCIYTSAGRNPGAEFLETDDPNFFGSSYSVVKGFTDRLMRASPVTLNVRIRMPVVGHHCSKNFLTKLTTYARINNTLNSVTVLPDLLPILLDLVKGGRVGTYHLVNPGPMTHAEILDLYREHVDPGLKYELMSDEELLRAVKADRSKCVLSTAAIEAEYHPPALRESLVAMFRDPKSWTA